MLWEHRTKVYAFGLDALDAAVLWPLTVNAVQMDLVLQKADTYFFTPFLYGNAWSPDDWKRQLLSLCLLVNIGSSVLYFTTASLNFFFIFDHRLMKHPLILNSQIRKEIAVSFFSIVFNSCSTAIIFFFEVRGYSKLYWEPSYERASTIHQTPFGYVTNIVVDIVCFMLFTDSLIYWIHRGLHDKRIYKYIHKVHHYWKVPTPFASHAMHPLDTFLQGAPYHLYAFLFPVHKLVYLGMFLFVNIWAVSVHDDIYLVPQILQPIVNGSAHHTDHHLLSNYNFGQFFTIWDRIGGTFRRPSAFDGKAPIDYVKNMSANKKKWDFSVYFIMNWKVGAIVLCCIVLSNYYF